MKENDKVFYIFVLNHHFHGEWKLCFLEIRNKPQTYNPCYQDPIFTLWINIFHTICILSWHRHCKGDLWVKGKCSMQWSMWNTKHTHIYTEEVVRNYFQKYQKNKFTISMNDKKKVKHVRFHTEEIKPIKNRNCKKGKHLNFKDCD